MRTGLIVVALMALTATSGVKEVAGQNIILDAIMRRILENLRDLMRTGNPETGMPILAPYHNPDLFINASFGGLIEFDARFTPMNIIGLDTFVGRLQVDLATLRFPFEFRFAELSANGFYDANGRLWGLIPIFGIGDFSVRPRDVVATGFATITDNGQGFLMLSDFSISLQIGSLESNIQGLLLGGDLSDLLNAVIQDIVPSVLRNFPDGMTNLLNALVVPIANRFLATRTMEDLMVFKMSPLLALGALLVIASNAATLPLQPSQLEAIAPEQRATLDEALAQLLENVRGLLRTGDPERGIPVMAPLQTDRLDVDLSLGGLLDFTAILRNLFVDGLDRFQGTLTLNVMQMEFRYDFLFPDVVARGHYDANGRLFGLIPVFGFGDFHVAPRDLRIQGTALLRQLPSGYLYMPELKANVRLGSLQSFINTMSASTLCNRLKAKLKEGITRGLDQFNVQFEKAFKCFSGPNVLAEMKILLAVACTVLVLGLAGAQDLDVGFVLPQPRDNALNELIIKFLEDFRQSMVCPNPDLGIPVLAPFKLDHFEVNIKQTGFEFKGELNKLVVDGLNEFEIKKIDVKVLKLQVDFEFYFGALRTKGKYKAKGKLIGLLPFSRSGSFSFDAKGLTIKGSVSVGISGDKLQIRNMVITPTVKSVRSNLKGIFMLPINNFIFNRMVEMVVPSLLNNNQEAITQAIEDQLKPAINEMLGDISLQDLIDMVSGGGGSGPVTC
uniref:Hemolymph juvenile hormone binding protein n=1 Tax=Anopheles christyi TaxID=43041 RepID=A0A182K5L4_9DIPT